MTKPPILALVVASSTSLQNGLLALMTTIPSIRTVLVAEDIESALRMVENHQPTLIILDITSLNRTDVIRRFKKRKPQIYIIVLLEDTAQQKELEVSGADCVLLKGFPPQKLIAALEDFQKRGESTSSA